MLLTRSPQPELFLKARKTLKCSQARLAQLLGVHRSTISRIEKGTQCPSAALMEGIERLTGTTAETLVADAYCCQRAQQQLAATAVALPADQYDYLHVKLHHEQALKRLRSRLRHKQRELATVRRCLAIDRSTVGALANQISNWQTIVDLLEASPAVQQNALESLQEFQESFRKKDRMALLWAQRFTFEMEDEIQLIQREIASRVQLLKAAEAKAAALKAQLQAVEGAKKVRTTVPPPQPKAWQEAPQTHTNAPPEPEAPESLNAPRPNHQVSTSSNTAYRRKPGEGETER